VCGDAAGSCTLTQSPPAARGAFDVFSSLDGFGAASGNWTGYWGKQGPVPLRSHGSLSMNRALMAAGLVDRVQGTLFPVITGQTGLDPTFQGAAAFDLELIESRTLDGHIQELIYRPALHV